MTKPTLIVFARPPAIGLGKTRLAREIGAVAAWRVYRSMLFPLIRTLKDPRWCLIVRSTGRWPGSEPQGLGDMGERLCRALRAHAHGRVAVIGADIPEVSRGVIWTAFRKLQGGRPVIGPATDGGFWLLALNPRAARRITLSSVRWSSTETLADTAAALGGDICEVATLSDIDTAADLMAWRQRQRSVPLSGVETLATRASSVGVEAPNLR